MNGAFFETYVVSELVKNFRSFNKEPRTRFFTTGVLTKKK